MRCPFCGNADTQVKDSRASEDGAAIRRRRACPDFRGRFTTFERVALQWRASLANINDRESLLANPDAIELPVNQIESNHVLVAEIDKACVGFACVQPRPDNDTELDGLFCGSQIVEIRLGPRVG